MLDAYIPDGALQPAREAALINRLTEIVIRHEGFDPADPLTRSVSWVFLHRPAAVYVGGEPADAPRYKVVVSVPEGQLDERKRAGVVSEVTEAILDAEAGARPRDAGRVWVFPTEVPEGYWGGRGEVATLADIIARLAGHDPEVSRALASHRIAATRANHARPPYDPTN
jgi:phenylpyruvate tautomerase PptA (4-oxalocrotonate tautomerase family)